MNNIIKEIAAIDGFCCDCRWPVKAGAEVWKQSPEWESVVCEDCYCLYQKLQYIIPLNKEPDEFVLGEAAEALWAADIIADSLFEGGWITFVAYDFHTQLEIVRDPFYRLIDRVRLSSKLPPEEA